MLIHDSTIYSGMEDNEDGNIDLIFIQGWEETTDAALTFLLRTSLAKVLKSIINISTAQHAKVPRSFSHSLFSEPHLLRFQSQSSTST